MRATISRDTESDYDEIEFCESFRCFLSVLMEKFQKIGSLNYVKRRVGKNHTLMHHLLSCPRTTGVPPILPCVGMMGLPPISVVACACWACPEGVVCPLLAGATLPAVVEVGLEVVTWAGMAENVKLETCKIIQKSHFSKNHTVYCKSCTAKAI